MATPLMKVHVAMVIHEYGSNAYVALTETELYRKVAEYVREWSTDLFGENAEQLEKLLAAGKHRKAVQHYFEHREGETLEVGTDTL